LSQDDEFARRLHPTRRTRHIGDFRNWKDYDAFKKAFDRLLRDLKSSG
jgi:hypothetical protein